MGMLQRFESRLEQAVSGAFAKAFRSAVQPVEIAAALQREVDNSAQILSRERRLVPNAFRVELSPTDHERLTEYADTLRAELAEMLHEHADEQHYVFAGPISIQFAQEDDLGTGRFRVSSRAAAEVSANERARRPARSTPAQPSGGDDTAAAQHLPRPSMSVALEVNGARHTITAPGAVVGRGVDADLRINDPGVSRRHAEFRLTTNRGTPTLHVVDLGSTNGTLVDGRRVDSSELKDGSTVRVGSTDLVVRLRREER